MFSMICDLDSDGNGNIDFEEFLGLMTSKPTDKNSRESYIKVFRMFDDDGSGFISTKHLRRVAAELNENIEDVEIDEMIKRADLDLDGVVNEEEFYEIMTRPMTQ
eukprot:GHVR01051578.1.p1 GENE.GHVR01051578.1~~GHVR01051578.1.p1  ORF type:complete len:105 (+),score=7.71 GHVR01051578.1:313-627(+)